MTVAATTAIDLISAVLPFVLVIGVFYWLIRSRHTPFRRDVDASLTKLDEIRDEIRRLRETIERQREDSRQ